MCVERIMTRKTLVVAPDDDLEAVRALMEKHRVYDAPVLEDGELVGVLSERNFRHCSAAAVVAAFMEEAVWVPPSATIREAALTMIESEVGILPVVDDRTPVGIVTKTDLLQAFCDYLNASQRSCSSKPQGSSPTKIIRRLFLGWRKGSSAGEDSA